MTTEQGADHRLKVAEERIQWVLDHPRMSDWVKTALRTACDRNPVHVLNDLEILNSLLRPRAQALVDRALVGSGSCEPANQDEAD
jgi:hypothetical protein